MVKVVPTVDPSESPVESRLVPMMTRTKFSEHAFAVGRSDGVQVWPKITAGHLCHQWCLGTGTKDQYLITGFCHPCLQSGFLGD